MGLRDKMSEHEEIFTGMDRASDEYTAKMIQAAHVLVQNAERIKQEQAAAAAQASEEAAREDAAQKEAVAREDSLRKMDQARDDFNKRQEQIKQDLIKQDQLKKGDITPPARTHEQSINFAQEARKQPEKPSEKPEDAKQSETEIDIKKERFHGLDGQEWSREHVEAVLKHHGILDKNGKYSADGMRNYQESVYTGLKTEREFRERMSSALDNAVAKADFARIDRKQQAEQAKQTSAPSADLKGKLDEYARLAREIREKELADRQVKAETQERNSAERKQAGDAAATQAAKRAAESGLSPEEQQKAVESARRETEEKVRREQAERAAREAEQQQQSGGISRFRGR